LLSAIGVRCQSRDRHPLIGVIAHAIMCAKRLPPIIVILPKVEHTCCSLASKKVQACLKMAHNPAFLELGSQSIHLLQYLWVITNRDEGMDRSNKYKKHQDVGSI
jgi:hypothetical protein